MRDASWVTCTLTLKWPHHLQMWLLAAWGRSSWDSTRTPRPRPRPRPGHRLPVTRAARLAERGDGVPPKSRSREQQPCWGRRGAQPPGLCPSCPSAPGSPGGHRQPPRHLGGRAVPQHGARTRAQIRCVPDPPCPTPQPRCCPSLPRAAQARPAALPLPCPRSSRPPLPHLGSHQEGRRVHRASLHSTPPTSIFANPGSCRPHILSTEPNASPLGGTHPVPKCGPGPGALVFCRPWLQLPWAQASPTKPPSPVLRSPSVSRAPGPWGHVGENAALTQGWQGLLGLHRPGTHPEFVPRLRAGQR